MITIKKYVLYALQREASKGIVWLWADCLHFTLRKWGKSGEWEWERADASSEVRFFTEQEARAALLLCQVYSSGTWDFHLAEVCPLKRDK